MNSEFWTMVSSVSSLAITLISIGKIYYDSNKLIIIGYKKNNRFYLKNIGNNPFLGGKCKLIIRPTKQGIIKLHSPFDTYGGINDSTKKINIFIQPITIQEELEITDIIIGKSSGNNKITLDENNGSEYSDYYNEAIIQAQKEEQDEHNYYMNTDQKEQEEIDNRYEIYLFEKECEYLNYHVFEIKIKRNSHLILFR